MPLHRRSAPTLLAALVALAAVACTPPRRCEGEDCGTTECTSAEDCGSSEKCEAGACVSACAAGTADCNGSADDACEVSTGDDAANCGACGKACASGLCRAGACVARAAVDVEVCAGIFENTLSCHTQGTALEFAFGETNVGPGVGALVRVKQAGSGLATIKTVRLSGDDEFVLEQPALPAKLAANESLDLRVVFSPVSFERRDAVLLIGSDDPAEGTITVLLSGSGRDGCELAFTAASLDFGATAIRGEKVEFATLENRGAAPCTIPSAPRISRGSEASFALAARDGFPMTIGPGSVLSTQVTYVPQDGTGPDEGEISVSSYGVDPAAARTATLALRGTPVRPAGCSLVAAPGGSDSNLAFGLVDTGRVKVLPIRFENMGQQPCTLANARVVSAPGTDGSAFTLRTPPPASLAPGATGSLDLAFAPSVAGPYGAMPPFAPTIALFVDTNDVATFGTGRCSMAGSATGPAGCGAWGLSGTGVAQPLAFEPGAISFGQVQVGCRSTQQALTIRNTGRTSVAIQSVSLVHHQSTTPVFTLTGFATPTSIAAGATKTLNVVFAPTLQGVRTASIEIATNIPDGAGGQRTVGVDLSGEGSASSRRTERWVQEPQPKADVLFVIDDSGSMAEEQASLASQVPAFIDAANAAGVDYQFGVVTTDVESSKAGLLRYCPSASSTGCSMQTPRIITPGSQAGSQLAATIRAMGTEGSANEAGLEAMKLALSAPRITDPAKNGGFLRADARLAVIVLSDEEDYSSGTTSTYATFLDNLKGAGGAAMTSLSAIVGPVNGCSGASGEADDGSRYRDVQQATGGRFRSICDSNWGSLAAEVAQDVFLPRSRFTLGVKATASSVVVKVNGVAAASGSWTFDEPGNAVVFAPSALPAAGANIEISYDAACL